MSMKTADLEGAELDYWVAKAEGALVGGNMFRLPDLGGFSTAPAAYSTTWAFAGPIIEREGIDLNTWNEREGQWCDCRGNWHAQPGWDADGGNAAKGSGPTALVAAMRAYVASRFGDEVKD